MERDKIIEVLKRLRDETFDDVPIGNIGTFELITVTNTFIKKLDKIISDFAELSPKDGIKESRLTESEVKSEQRNKIEELMAVDEKDGMYETAVKDEEIPNDIVTKMQKEFQPETSTSFNQGMYSGYAFGLQDGFKFALRSRLQPAQITDEQIEKYFNEFELNTKNVLFGEELSEVVIKGAKIGAKAYRDGQIAEWVKENIK